MSFLIKPFAFLLIILAGILLRQIGFFKEHDHRLISRIILTLTLPCAAIQAFGGAPQDTSLVLVIFIGFLCSSIPMFTMYFTTKRKDKRHRIFSMLNAGGYNLGCFSLPLVQSIFGATGGVVVCSFDIGNAIMATGGSYAITSTLLHTDQDGDGPADRDTPLKLLKKFVTSVSFDTYMVLLVLMLLHIPIPQIIMQLTEPLGQANPFLAMLMLGMMFQPPRERRYWKDAIWMLAVRFIIATIFSLLVFWCTPFSLEIRQVLAVTVFAPMGVLGVVYTERCHGDAAQASFVNSLSVLLSLTIMSSLSVFLLR